MAAPSLTYSLTNGTTADASQVMQNFNDILNGITDGSKDLSISALTCAGTATLNGHINLGNSSSDDLTITASLASSLVPKTDATYALGSSSIGFSGLYLSNGSGLTARVIAAAHVADRDYTIPDCGANASFVMTAQTQTIGGAKTFSAAATFSSTVSAAGVILASDGAVSAPGYSFTSDPDSGLYSSNANELSFATNGAQRFTISSTGAMTTRNSTTSGSFTQAIFRDGDGSSCGTIVLDTTANTTAYNTSSDARLKQDLKEFDGLGLVAAMKLYDFEWKVAPGRRSKGVLAQELALIAPDAVSQGEEDENGDIVTPWGVDYGKLTPLLARAIQQLKARVEALEAS